VRHGEHVYLAPSGVQKERIKPEHIFVLPFAQSSVPKPGSQRDFLRIPTQAVRPVIGMREVKLTYRVSRSQHVLLCSGTHSPCVTLEPVSIHTLSTLASPSSSNLHVLILQSCLHSSYPATPNHSEYPIRK